MPHINRHPRPDAGSDARRRWSWLAAPVAALLGLWTNPLTGAPAVAEKPSAERAEAPAAEDPAPGEQWVRIVRDRKQTPVAMETAVVRYAAAKGGPSAGAAAPQGYVDLVGAVHIGDLGYYRELNKRFKRYDAVLYELVAAEGTKVPRGRGTSNSHPLGAIQNGMKSMLEVEHQLEQIDYTRPNMIHADLSPEEFFKSMADRDEGFTKMYFKMLGASVAQQSQMAAGSVSPEVDMMAALFSDDRPRRLKLAMAKQFESMDGIMAGLSGPEGSTLITERNNRALDVLEKQLAAGVEKLAVFYGAGHLADMHEQMASRFDMHPVAVEWLEAWNLREK
jgi:hypothetical protein